MKWRIFSTPPQDFRDFNAELLFGVGEVFSNLLPVNRIPPSFKIFGAPILIFQIVGVFPDVQAEESFSAVHDGIVLIRGGSDGELAIAKQQPSPAGAKPFGGGIVEFCFEVGKTAER